VYPTGQPRYYFLLTAIGEKVLHGSSQPLPKQFTAIHSEALKKS